MRILFSMIIALLIASGCNSDKKPLQEESTKPSKSASYFDSLFIRYGDGFTGGDGTYSVQLPDGRNVWIFGDTFLGTVSKDFKREQTDPLYIRNSFLLQDGDQITTLRQGEPSEFKSMMIPPEALAGETTEHKMWYWPGDGFVRADTLWVFASKFTQFDTGMWDFKFVETALLGYSLPEIKEVVHTTIDGTRDLPIHFGHAIYQEDSYTYIYGLGPGGPYAARAENSLTENWKYWTGADWSDQVADAKPMKEISGSEQFTVLKLEGQYVYVTQGGGLSDRVYALTAQSPVGPWSDSVEIYKTPLPFDNKNLFTYNSLIHPQHQDDSTVLLSYNTNSMVLQDHFDNAAIYRPRFARIPIQRLLKR